MKKLLIGAIVGGILVFFWQTLSWTILHLHDDEYRQANGQEEVISYLSSKFSGDGQYMIPRAKDGASREEMEAMEKSMQGKPWAVVSYHQSYGSNMTQNIIRGLLVSIFAALFVCWVLMKQTRSSFGTTFISAVLIGVSGYLFIPYSQHIWFQNPGATTNMVDTLVAWGLCGIWLGWWLNRK